MDQCYNLETAFFTLSQLLPLYAHLKQDLRKLSYITSRKLDPHLTPSPSVTQTGQFAQPLFI